MIQKQSIVWLVVFVFVVLMEYSTCSSATTPITKRYTCDLEGHLKRLEDDIDNLLCLENRIDIFLQIYIPSLNMSSTEAHVQKRRKQLDNIRVNLAQLTSEYDAIKQATTAPNQLINQSDPTIYITLSCPDGWFGENCSQTMCFDIQSNETTVCSGNGACVGFNNCSCSSEYTGFNCSIPICFGVAASSPNVCSSFGTCVAPNQCQCNNTRIGDYCQLNVPRINFKKLADPTSYSATGSGSIGPGKYGVSYASYNGKLYAFGGASTTLDYSSRGSYFFQEYNPITNTWSIKSVSGVFITRDQSMVVVNETAYVYGGYYSSGNSYYTTNRLAAYSFNTNTWTPLSNTASTRFKHAAVAVSSKIYVFGGYTTTSNQIPTNLFQVYDTVSNSWATVTQTNPLLAPSARYSPSMIAISSKIYILGGSCYQCTLLDFYEFDTQTNTWKILANVPKSYFYGGAIYHQNGHIYLYNGLTSGSVYVYDISKNTWTEITDLTGAIPGGRGSPGFATIGSTHYFGGGTYSIDLYSLEIY